jgi:hypothetical protein
MVKSFQFYCQNSGRDAVLSDRTSSNLMAVKNQAHWGVLFILYITERPDKEKRRSARGEESDKDSKFNSCMVNIARFPQLPECGQVQE